MLRTSKLATTRTRLAFSFKSAESFQEISLCSQRRGFIKTSRPTTAQTGLFAPDQRRMLGTDHSKANKVELLRQKMHSESESEVESDADMSQQVAARQVDQPSQLSEAQQMERLRMVGSDFEFIKG